MVYIQVTDSRLGRSWLKRGLTFCLSRSRRSLDTLLVPDVPPSFSVCLSLAPFIGADVAVTNYLG